ncbi:hypothetical protein L596_026518 [Steinernema carpocapsae]|uniref:Major facilitator superfamily (MFS) profile domain-containing protein n=1 Tax=Steinernema carpocapsae TaxID=34508 RepID=A0A4U5M1M0_STECR|nr:hypothetical protein L596_026518 [Steinernema carpocapsae]
MNPSSRGQATPSKKWNSTFCGPASMSSIRLAASGQLISYAICDSFGRKNTAILACIIAIPGLLMSIFSKLFFPYYEFLVLGRFLWGVANGISTVVMTVWMIESSPTKFRGNIGTWQEGIATMGNLLTQAVVSHRHLVALHLPRSLRCQPPLHVHLHYHARISSMASYAPRRPQRGSESSESLPRAQNAIGNRNSVGEMPQRRSKQELCSEQRTAERV